MANEKRLTWKRSLDGYTDVGLCEGVTVDDAICKLADLEEMDAVEVVDGRWIAVDSSYWRWAHDGGHVVERITYRCSECARKSIIKTNYCPNCGAKMDGGNQDG